MHKLLDFRLQADDVLHRQISVRHRPEGVPHRVLAFAFRPPLAQQAGFGQRGFGAFVTGTATGRTVPPRFFVRTAVCAFLPLARTSRTSCSRAPSCASCGRTSSRHSAERPSSSTSRPRESCLSDRGFAVRAAAAFRFRGFGGRADDVGHLSWPTCDPQRGHPAPRRLPAGHPVASPRAGSRSGALSCPACIFRASRVSQESMRRRFPSSRRGLLCRGNQATSRSSSRLRAGPGTKATCHCAGSNFRQRRDAP